jgi:hypothetical protein
LRGVGADSVSAIASRESDRLAVLLAPAVGLGTGEWWTADRCALRRLPELSNGLTTRIPRSGPVRFACKGQPPLPAEPLPDVLPWKYSGNRLHPTQKPVECPVALIEAFCPSCSIVLDPFAGSGSTCVAARQTSRRFFGIELDATYHAAATARLNRPPTERVTA